MEKCLGEPVKILPGGADPWAKKLEVLAKEVYTFIDVDVVFRRRYDLTSSVVRAEEGYFVAPIPEYRDRLKLPETFITSGMYTLDPSKLGDMLELARSKYSFGGTYSLKDEYALNEALVELKVPVHFLRKNVHRFAYMFQSSKAFRPDDYSRHYCGGACENLVRLAHIKHAAHEAWENLQTT